MPTTPSIEQSVLERFRSLPLEKQQEVLDFVEFLHQRSVAEQPLHPLSLQQIAMLPLEERHQHLAQYIPATAEDFRTDPELTEFSVLDGDDWELDDV